MPAISDKEVAAFEKYIRLRAKNRGHSLGEFGLAPKVFGPDARLAKCRNCENTANQQQST